MVRETRHLWVGNLPENIREDRIREHFKRYGRVQSVKLLPRISEEKTGEVSMACTVAFMDIKSASKAHNAELKIDDRTLNTEYYEPAAIPSAASPQGTPPPYSTSPGITRFPNSHGSDDHGLPDAISSSARLYDRLSSTGVVPSGVNRAPSDGPTESRRSALAISVTETGSATCRSGRNRDRLRIGGTRKGSAALWGIGYDNVRYSSNNDRSQSETTGYNSAPSDSSDRRNLENVKKDNSRSGSRSPSPNGSSSSRSPSRSRSQSSSSSSSSSTSRDTSSTSSQRSRRRRHHKKSSQFNSDDRRPLAICVRNLPLRSSDTSLKDGLFHEYKKHGKVTWVRIVGQNSDRYAIVCFKKPEDAEKALEVSYDKLFFGCKIEVAPYAVCDVDEVDGRYESEIDEYNPKATRTLFIGNLEKDVTASDLRKHFEQFGEIIEIDIKKQGAVSSYAFCQYADIVSVVKAIRKMDGEHLGNNRIKLGFGKSMAYNCVWIDGVNENVNDKYLRMQFEPFGVINKCIIDHDKRQALIFYEHVSQAQLAVSKMRGFILKNSKLQVDFASRECQECFFDRLEKQGTVLDRETFDDRKEPAPRNFESVTASRMSRYDTPTRPRTSSYSSRSSLVAVTSPGTPGSATPRGGRARVARYYDYELDYGAIEGRHVNHRNYDEYSQGSEASHEDPYDPYDHVGYLHSSPGHLDPIEVRMVPNLVDAVPFAPHDIRNLQKERVHLLEQLEECPSSGDELISPKKRLKLDLMDPTITGDVIIETNRDHNRKVMEVRRLSETTIRHHSRRPSVDSKYHYAPHAVGCKRRRTAGSDGGSRIGGHMHYTEHSDASENGGSRPGTPLCDENPEFPLGDPPKRTTRDRDGPLMLPLPKWAAQIRVTPEFQRGTLSVAGVKGQKEHINPLASPPPAATSPRVSQHYAVRPCSPSHIVPPPASPPRPPSLSSNSSESDGAPPSPSLEERIRSLDEKYEKWSGSRALSASGNDALALLNTNREKFRLRHKLLEIQDLKEVQPSEIVKSVMAKKSVFDEDLKRLESVGEKYEPKEFGLLSNRLSCLTSCTISPTGSTMTGITTSVAVTSSKLTTNSVHLPLKTPTTLSPRSAGSTIPIPATRVLQYPFPSHPPIKMSSAVMNLLQVPSGIICQTVILPSAASATSTTSTVATARCPNVGENRVKPTVSASGDSWNSSTRNQNAVIVPENVNVICSSSELTNIGQVKSSENISFRRSFKNTSPLPETKTSRNSETSSRRTDNCENIEAESDEYKFLKNMTDNTEMFQKGNEGKEVTEKGQGQIEKEELENDGLKQDKDEEQLNEELDSKELKNERLEKNEMKNDKENEEREQLATEGEEDQTRLEIAKFEKEQFEKIRLEEEKVKDLLKNDYQEKQKIGKEIIQEINKMVQIKQKLHLKQERTNKVPNEAEETDKSEIRTDEYRTVENKQKEYQKIEDRGKSKDLDSHERNIKYKETYSETRHKEDNINCNKNHQNKFTTDSNEERLCSKDKTKSFTKDVTHESHDQDSCFDSKSNTEGDFERQKENLLDKHKTESKDLKNRAVVETRHMSLDLDKNVISTKDVCRKKERINSLPANVGLKRRMSSQESMKMFEDNKKMKFVLEQKNDFERRGSNEHTKSDENIKDSKNTNSSSSSSHEKHYFKDCDEKVKEKECEEKHKKHKHEKQKTKIKNKEKESQRSKEESLASENLLLSDKDFLANLHLISNKDIENDSLKEKEQLNKVETRSGKADIEENSLEENLKPEKQMDDKETSKLSIIDNHKTRENRKPHKKERNRKIALLSLTSESDSDEPKKRSIFDIEDDGPTYISMYDKVKARSCKNIQKQEEEKRQEKIKATFSQLKLSRARREEKKRSTSWDDETDSEKESDVKSKRNRKVLYSSDESQERKIFHMHKEVLRFDSENSFSIKSELEITDEEKKSKYICTSPLSKIDSECLGDDYLDKEILSKNITHRFYENKEKENVSDLCIENILLEDNDIKLEKRTFDKNKEKHGTYQEFSSSEHQPLNNPQSERLNVKSEVCNTFDIDNSTDDDCSEIKKEKPEQRERKHKKKQRKQRHWASVGDNKVDLKAIQDNVQVIQERKHDKRKDYTKKDKKREKNKDCREKAKKQKKSKSDDKIPIKDDAMENVFSSLSADSETEFKNKKNILKSDESVKELQFLKSDSEEEPEVKSQEQAMGLEYRNKKEKKRREKERRLQEAAAAAADEPPHSDENSMDFIDMGKQLEANIKGDIAELELKTPINSFNLEVSDTFVCQPPKLKEKEERKEVKEKKKKRKKSKDEKKHHHHHHSKEKFTTLDHKPESTETPLTSFLKELKTEEDESTSNQNPVSLYNVQNPIINKSNAEYTLSPKQGEVTVNPIFNKSVIQEGILPSFNTKIDQTINKNDGDSICANLVSIKAELNIIKEIELKETVADTPEDKPRVVISQEETEDAVAALLGESFGSTQFEDRYAKELTAVGDENVSELAVDANVQDDEEMRKAVQSLEAEDDIVKPETPQSEHELQIDTDTEEQEEASLITNQGTKTPEVPTLIAMKSTGNKVFPNSCEMISTSTPIIYKPIGSPPSLTPIKSQSAASEKMKKNLEVNSTFSVLNETQISVLSQSWPEEKRDIKSDASTILDSKKHVTQPLNAPPPLKTFKTSPSLKSKEPSFPPLVKLSAYTESKVQTSLTGILPDVISSAVSQRQNLSARSQDELSKSSIQEDIILSKSTAITVNRIPVTPIVTKPLQINTVFLPQPKLAHSCEAPKLVSPSDSMSQACSRTIIQTASTYSAFSTEHPSRMVIQGNSKHATSTSLLMPSKHINTTVQGKYMENMKQLSNFVSSSTDIKMKPEEAVKLSSISSEEQIRSNIGIAESHGALSPSSAKTQISKSCNLNPPELVFSSQKLTQTSFDPKPSSPKSPNTNENYISMPSKEDNSRSTPVIIENSHMLFTHKSAECKEELRELTPKSAVDDIVDTGKISDDQIEVSTQIEDLSIPISESKISTNTSVFNPNVHDKSSKDVTYNSIKLEVEKLPEELAIILKQKEDVYECQAVNANIIKNLKDVENDNSESKNFDHKLNTQVNETGVKEDEVKSHRNNKDFVDIVDILQNKTTAIKAVLSKNDDSSETKEDNDFWSAKDSLNIDSVIKILNSADELSDNDNSSSCKRSERSYIDQKNISDENKILTASINKTGESTVSEEKLFNETNLSKETNAGTEYEKSNKSVTRSSARRGRGRKPRGSKIQQNIVERGGIQTRRGKLKEAQAQTVCTVKRGRSSKTQVQRKSKKTELAATSNDVYEFREDSDDNKEQRPRLVLTIKSTSLSTSNLQTTATVKEITKDGDKEIIKEIKDIPSNKSSSNQKEDLSSPQTNTRKSRRLAEKDVSKNTVDDTIEDVVKNSPHTRLSSNQRRSFRQIKKPQLLIEQQDISRKCLRSRKTSGRGSEAIESPSRIDIKNELTKVPEEPIQDKQIKCQSPVQLQPPETEKAKEPLQNQLDQKLDYCSLKTAMLKRFKSAIDSCNKPEPTNLIDPVTGVLTPMHESEEGKYIPLSNNLSGNKNFVTPPQVKNELIKNNELGKLQDRPTSQLNQTSVIPLQCPNVSILKSQVSSNPTSRAVITEQPSLIQVKKLATPGPIETSMVKEEFSQTSSSMVVSKSSSSLLISKCEPPVTQTLTITTSITQQTIGSLSPRPGIPVFVTSDSQIKTSVLSTNRPLLLTNQQHLLRTKEQVSPPKTNMGLSLLAPQTQIPHNKHRQEKVIIGVKSATSKTHSINQQQILTGKIAAPHSSKSQKGQIIQEPSETSSKCVKESLKIDVNIPITMTGRPSISPSRPQSRLSCLSVSSHEANLKEPVAHYPAVPGPNLAQYMHQQQVIQYQQFFRQHQLQHIQRSTNSEKLEEGAEAPIGLPISSRGAAVPHHSPHDRATESPAVGQVYNTLTHSARLPPYHPGSRYYDQKPAEPPPAHRPLSSFDRAGLPHMSALGTPDRPLGAHLGNNDRPVGAHITPHLASDRPSGTVPERALSAQLVHDRCSQGSLEKPQTTYVYPERPLIGSGLGAAGNLIGAVAKHIGEDVSASQRGIQAATPPLASQVPPQAESLFMILKQYPLMWQGLLALKNDQAAVQMYFISGNNGVARMSLPKNTDGSTPPLRIFQRMRLEPTQVEGVARKMQMENEHCILLALPCGHDHMDVLKQSYNLTTGFITYLQSKQAAGIINVAAPGTTQPPAYVVHIFPSCDFVNENLRRIAPSLLERVADIAHLLIVITTV